MNEIKWRFPGNSYAAESGLDTSDMETFKKDPIASLARELCQNSIDARNDKTSPVSIEFNLFPLEKENIPGGERILREIKSCKNEWASNLKISRELKKMEEALQQDMISVLRISDFNTTGLVGVSTNEKKSFYLLTKGSGISDKVGTSGGSKGIGKFATFVASDFNTVFYHTVTIEEEVGYQGICKLCSTSQEGTDEKTQGIGYFGNSEKNQPILEPFSLDGSFKRKANQYGTDIYVLGFRKENTWIKEIITKVLDSFMVAILFQELEIKIQNITINSQTIGKIVRDDELILHTEKKNIISQYILLTDEMVYKEVISIEDYGEAKLYVKGFSKEEMDIATNNCVMVRYPYMKIKTIKNISSVPCSAMCIIGDNNLNKVLRDLENPQHTDWEVKRIRDYSQRKEIGAIIRTLKKEIMEIVMNFLTSSDNSQTDVEGASDYLPDVGSEKKEEIIVKEKPTLYKPKKNKEVEKTGYYDDEDGSVLEPDIGTLVEGEEAPLPKGENKGNDGGPHDTEGKGGIEEGENDVLRYVQLTGIKYRFIVLDKDEMKYAIVFDSPVDEEDCEMELYYIDVNGTKYPVKIIDSLLNGNKCEIINENKIHFELFANKRYSFELITDQDELFACEVKIYAYR